MPTQVAIITGAGRGLGRSVAQGLARRKVAVVLAGRSLKHLEEVRDAVLDEGGAAMAVPTDVSDAASVEGLFETCLSAYGRLDVLVNNAGVTAQVGLADMTEDEWDRIFDINTRGMFLCSRAAARVFAPAGSGRAINIASVFGLLGRPGFTAYGASKGAVINFTRAAAAEWAKFGAQMNAVAPGYFATDINAELRDDEGAVAKVLRRIPARRMGRPEELAGLVTYLSLDAPDFLTGQTIAIDGGESSV
ncbi:glucose 1-dehydrogenase [Streptomyces sp. NBC_01795]|uniref:SDR family NAD(P)-dependent oxidoreductase n=1 Tax=unclassified Streptomyces TaxID=2593676 RepID=UPI002DD7A155|nr:MULTISPECIES: glucose 1-dehydrogenase [unclassified Streptomyces]WSA90605.1 glucose 1-dehydrogenase [Streptomyces sp. NBC_01795]WSB74931.1 glucose 1-dehydrogenase [Streptomyces sp. NBC_01775]WSS16788.1 glucose 1-dehydrogenase [Streptomyces sp. NBC_01186]